MEISSVSSGNSAEIGALAPDAGSVANMDQLLAQATRTLSELEPKLPIKFTFMWRSCAFSARLESAPNGVLLLLRGELGLLPFSAENPDSREKLIALKNDYRDDPLASFGISCDQRLYVLGEIEVPETLSAAAIFGWTTSLLLRLDAPIEVAQPYCLRPPASV
jgi:hypothetical protein